MFRCLYPENEERPYICQCRRCFTRTGGFPSEEEAIESWNEAMSARELDLKQAYDRGYAQAKEDEAVNRRWEDSYNVSRFSPYSEMGG